MLWTRDQEDRAHFHELGHYEWIGQPGLRWSICIRGKSTFSYTTGEVLAFLRGVHTLQGHEAPLLAAS